MKPVKVNNLKSSIAYNYYEADKDINLVNPFKLTPVKSGVVPIINLDKKQRADKFAFEFYGFIKIQKDGIFTFFTESDDGSKLFIDDIEIVNNDGEHGAAEKSGRAALKKGFHKIKVLYFDSGGGNTLKVLLQKEGGEKQELSPSLLFSQ